MKDALKEAGKRFVMERIGGQYVSEFEEKYDKWKNNEPIGGLLEAAAFLDLLETIKTRMTCRECYWCKMIEREHPITHKKISALACTNTAVKKRHHTKEKEPHWIEPSRKICKAGFTPKEVTDE